jgi:hypothetical protein
MHRPKITIRLILAVSFILVWGTACSSPIQQPVTAPATQPAADEAPLATDTAVPQPTPTTAVEVMEPTAEPTVIPTEAVLPSPTPEPEKATPTSAAPQPLTAESVQGWCLPEGAALAVTGDPLNPPTSARVGESSPDSLEIRNLPVIACVFTYTLNGPAPENLQLQVFEMRAGKPWLTADLTPVEGSPNTVSAVLRHNYIIAPPLWDVSYKFALVDSGANTELRRDTVNLHRWTPELCWNQQKPNPITLRCPLPQDQHPWDPWYGKPMPTGVPEEDD